MDINAKLKLLAVRIEEESEESQPNYILGSGILWVPKTNREYMYVFTAAHVVWNSKKLIVRYWDQHDNARVIKVHDDNIVVHPNNNCKEFEENKEDTLKNDVAVLRCTKEGLDYLYYAFGSTRSIGKDEELIFRGFPQKIFSNNLSITLGREIRSKYSISDINNGYFCYEVDEKLKPENEDEDLKGLSGSGVFLKKEPLTLIGIHSHGEKDMWLNNVRGMDIECVVKICTLKGWDVPKVSRLDVSLNEILSGSNWIEINEEFFVSHKKLSIGTLESFLNGSSCTWALINNDVVVKRDKTNEIVNEIEYQRCIGLLAAGGEGKSTILMQICKELYERDYRVFWYSEGIERTIFHNNLYDEDRQIIFVVDDVVGDANFEKFTLAALERGYKVIFSARDNEWKYVRTNSASRKLERELVEIQLGGISKTEAGKFADLIVNNFKNKEKESIEKIFLEKSEAFLLAAMLVAVNGKSLKEIVYDITLKIKQRNQDILKILAIICYFENLGEKSSDIMNISKNLYKMIYELNGISKTKISNLLSREICENNKNIRTRHPIISKFMLEFLIYNDDAEFELNELLYDFIEMINKKFINKKTGMPLDSNERELQRLIFAIMDDLYTNKEQIVEEKREEILRLVKDKYKNYGHMWIYWGQLEKEKGRIGSNVEDEFSARWIYNSGVKSLPSDENIYIHWAELEIDEGNNGASIYEKYTARWIYQKGIENCENPGNIYIHWAELEINEKNPGTSIHDQYSARWIYKKGIEHCPDCGNVYLKWAELEQEEKNDGKSISDQYSARWIYKKGIEHCLKDNNIYIHWAELEIKEKNLGTSIHDQYSARWIYKKGIEHCTKDSHIYIHWAELEINEKNPGTSIHDQYSARWIYKKGIEHCTKDNNLYIHWAELEINEKNPGTSIHDQYSARWIYKKGVDIFPSEGNLYNKWIKLEMEFDEDDTALKLAIESLEYTKNTLQLLVLIQAKMNNFSADDPYSVPNCINAMKVNSNNEYVSFLAYKCYEMNGFYEISQMYKNEISSEAFVQFEEFFKTKRLKVE